MNIFVTDKDPGISAKVLDDSRVIKMALESAQTLSTTINLLAGEQTGPYRTTHPKHPCSMWARTSSSNYLWLYEHYAALCAEYTSRFGKVHKCYEHSIEFKSKISLLPAGSLTPFANCAGNSSLGIDFRNEADTTKAYRDYLNARWSIAKIKPRWTNAKPPVWSNI